MHIEFVIITSIYNIFLNYYMLDSTFIISALLFQSKLYTIFIVVYEIYTLVTNVDIKV